jgi:hypothetical protein
LCYLKIEPALVMLSKLVRYGATSPSEPR